LYTSEGLESGPGYQSSSVPQPSNTEVHRLYRPTRRWDIYSKLFGGNVEDLDRADSAQRASGAETQELHDEYERASGFLGLSPIHQVEELACLHSFAKHKFEDHIVSVNVGSMITSGPAFMYNIMTTPSEHDIRDIRYSRQFLTLIR